KPRSPAVRGVLRRFAAMAALANPSPPRSVPPNPAPPRSGVYSGGLLQWPHSQIPLTRGGYRQTPLPRGRGCTQAVCCNGRTRKSLSPAVGSPKPRSPAVGGVLRRFAAMAALANPSPPRSVPPNPAPPRSGVYSGGLLQWPHSQIPLPRGRFPQTPLPRGRGCTQAVCCNGRTGKSLSPAVGSPKPRSPAVGGVLRRFAAMAAQANPSPPRSVPPNPAPPRSGVYSGGLLQWPH